MGGERGSTQTPSRHLIAQSRCHTKECIIIEYKTSTKCAVIHIRTTSPSNPSGVWGWGPENCHSENSHDLAKLVITVVLTYSKKTYTEIGGLGKLASSVFAAYLKNCFIERIQHGCVHFLGITPGSPEERPRSDRG